MRRNPTPDDDYVVRLFHLLPHLDLVRNTLRFPCYRLVLFLRLHLGPGWRYFTCWQHLDITKRDHIDFVGSVSELSQFNQDSVDVIYASHLLEYFDASKAVDVLPEWRSVLRIGGQIYLAVPDFKALLKIYERTDDKKILGPLFAKMESDVGAIYHRTVYDKSSLFAVLEQVGFGEIEEYDLLAFLGNFDATYYDHSLAFFPHMDRSGIQVSLCVKGTK